MKKTSKKIKPEFFNDQHKREHRIFKSTFALILPWWAQNIFLEKMILKYSPTVKNVRKSRYRGNLAGRKFGKIAKYTIGLILPLWLAMLITFIIKIILWVIYKIGKLLLFFLPINIDWLDDLFEEIDFDAVAEELDISSEDLSELTESVKEDLNETVNEKVQEKIEDSEEIFSKKSKSFKIDEEMDEL